MNDQARLLEKPINKYASHAQYPPFLPPNLVTPLPDQAYEELVTIRKRLEKNHQKPTFTDLEQILDAKIIDILRAQIKGENNPSIELQQQKDIIMRAVDYLADNPDAFTVDISLEILPDEDWKVTIGKKAGSAYHITYDRDSALLEEMKIQSFMIAVDFYEELKVMVSKLRDGKRLSEDELENVRIQLADWRNDWRETAENLEGDEKRDAEANANIFDNLFEQVLDYEPQKSKV